MEAVAEHSAHEARHAPLPHAPLRLQRAAGASREGKPRGPCPPPRPSAGHHRHLPAELLIFALQRGYAVLVLGLLLLEARRAPPQAPELLGGCARARTVRTLLEVAPAPGLLLPQLGLLLQQLA